MVALDPHHPDPDTIEHAAAVLRRGGLVAFPTETVYGLGADATSAAAVAAVFEAKGRPATDPLIVHLAAAPQPVEQAHTAPPRQSRSRVRPSRIRVLTVPSGSESRSATSR